jgi:hypothetical protein
MSETRVGCQQCGGILVEVPERKQFECSSCGYCRDWDLDKLKAPGQLKEESKMSEEQPEPVVQAPEPEAEVPAEAPVEESAEQPADEPVEEPAAEEKAEGESGEAEAEA